VVTKKVSKRKRTCPKCKCPEALVSSIVAGFKKCLECKYIHVSSVREVERFSTKRFGLGNKSIEKAIADLVVMQKSIPEDYFNKIHKGYDGEYYLVISRPETDEELLKRFIKAEDKVKKSLVAKEKREAVIEGNKKKRAEQEVQRLKQKELRVKKEAKLRDKKDKEKKKLEDFLNKNGLSLDAVRDVLVG